MAAFNPSAAPEPGCPDPRPSPSSCNSYQPQHWLHGDPAQVADYLSKHPELREQPHVLLDLIYQEWIRLEVEGSPIDLEAWCARFPHLSAQLRDHMEALRAVDAATPAAADSPRCPAAEPPAAGNPQPVVPGLDFFGSRFLAPPQGPGELGRLGGYRVLRVLGSGGMGVVMHAEEINLGRSVALKVVKPTIAASEAARQRFLREARSAAAVEHEHVVVIYRVDEANGVPYLVMPYLEGESLSARLYRQAPLPLPEVLRIGREMALGLAAAHQRGLVHRDLKPANVWLEGEAGKVKLLDFGLARPQQDPTPLSEPGAVQGTPAYMAPEQARGEAVDSRADLFSLGCVLYQMTTSRQPFAGKDTLAVLTALALDTPPSVRDLNPAVPEALANLIGKLLAKRPADRPSSAAEVAAALGSLENKSSLKDAPLPDWMGPVAAPPTDADSGRWPTLVTGISPFLRWGHRRRVWALGTLGVLAVVGLVTLGISLAGKLSPRGDQSRIDVQTPVSVAPEGWIDVLVWGRGGDGQRYLGLANFGALPLRTGGMVRVEAQMEPAAFLYVFWIDTEGQAKPVYPWKPGEWGTRPAQEQRQTRLSLPAGTTGGWEVTGTADGMETLLLWAREAPLDLDDTALMKLLGGLPPQRPLRNEGAAVWFADGEIMTQDPLRRAVLFEAKEIDDPVLRLQQLLREKLRPHGGHTRAVTFAKLGK